MEQTRHYSSYSDPSRFPIDQPAARLNQPYISVTLVIFMVWTTLQLESRMEFINYYTKNTTVGQRDCLNGGGIIVIKRIIIE